MPDPTAGTPRTPVTWGDPRHRDRFLEAAPSVPGECRRPSEPLSIGLDYCETHEARWRLDRSRCPLAPPSLTCRCYEDAPTEHPALDTNVTPLGAHMPWCPLSPRPTCVDCGGDHPSGHPWHTPTAPPRPTAEGLDVFECRTCWQAIVAHHPEYARLSDHSPEPKP